MSELPIDPLPKVWDPDTRIGDMLKGVDSEKTRKYFHLSRLVKGKAEAYTNQGRRKDMHKACS